MEIKKLGWEQLMDWKEGLRLTIKWYEENIGNWKSSFWMEEFPSTVSVSDSYPIVGCQTSNRRRSSSTYPKDFEFIPKNILVTGGAGFM